MVGMKELIESRVDLSLKEDFEKQINEIIEIGYQEDVKKLGKHRAELIKKSWEANKPYLFFAYNLGQAKSQAVPEGRTDIQIIEQTIGIVRLIGESNSFECANSKVFPFESKSPRLQVWWRVACEIQELLTDTDPNNCDFEEYKAMIEAQEQSNG